MQRTFPERHLVAKGREAERWVAGIHKYPQLQGEGNGNTLQYSCLENPMDMDGGAR